MERIKKYRRRKANGRENNVVIYTPDGNVEKHLIEQGAWNKAGKIIDELNLKLYESGKGR